MGLKIDIDKKDNAVSLDRIIDMVLENAEADPQKQFEAVIENQSSDLHDVMSDAGIAYLKHGMKLGARVVFELLY